MIPSRSPAERGPRGTVIDVDDLVRGVTSLSCPVVAEDRVHWIEGSRLMVARGSATGEPAMPDGPDVRSDLYGYGAVPYAVHGPAIIFVGAHDQALYRYDRGRVTRLSATAEDAEATTRFGAPAVTPEGRWVYCVREREFGSRTVHDLVRLSADGSGDPVVVAQGHDFYGAPVLRPDGSALAFITWDFPDMPWDRSRLWEASPTGTAGQYAVHPVAGGPEESITQPAYGPDGRLHFVSDRTGWWNIWQRQPSGDLECLLPQDAEFGRPDWFCGRRTYGFTGAGIVAVACRDGRDQLVRIRNGTAEAWPVPVDAVEFVATAPGAPVVLVGAAPDRAPAVLRLAAGTGGPPAADGEPDTLRSSWPCRPHRSRISIPEHLAVPGDDGRRVHALFYPPAGPQRADGGAPPPLLVSCHGGPTVLAGLGFDVQVQFWTSRGFAVAAVNYRGSPGFGRAYRQSLRGRWGILDVDDCLAVVRHLTGAGMADAARVVARGKSSGGLTALRMAARAGRSGVHIAAVIAVSGVTDPADLPERTHKMESRYLDGLIGPWPGDRAVYESRSVFADLPALTAPVLLVHGAQDRVVPVEQARRLHRGLLAQGVRAELLTFDDEGHAIRQPGNVRRAALAEVEFLRTALGDRSARLPSHSKSLRHQPGT